MTEEKTDQFKRKAVQGVQKKNSNNKENNAVTGRQKPTNGSEYPSFIPKSSPISTTTTNIPGVIPQVDLGRVECTQTLILPWEVKSVFDRTALFLIGAIQALIEVIPIYTFIFMIHVFENLPHVYHNNNIPRVIPQVQSGKRAALVIKIPRIPFFPYGPPDNRWDNFPSTL
ncbi:hypothetical protein H5410_054780, partial [Solanum commersonii]